MIYTVSNLFPTKCHIYIFEIFTPIVKIIAVELSSPKSMFFNDTSFNLLLADKFLINWEIFCSSPEDPTICIASSLLEIEFKIILGGVSEVIKFRYSDFWVKEEIFENVSTCFERL